MATIDNSGCNRSSLKCFLARLKLDMLKRLGFSHIEHANHEFKHPTHVTITQPVIDAWRSIFKL